VTSNNTNTTAKYRPSLTAAQIRYILKLAKLESPLTEESKSVIKTLSPFLAKIDNEAISPAYEYAERPSILESLGADSLNSPEFNKETNKAIINSLCYEQWKQQPESCSLEEIAAAQEHAYINDLMTPEEEESYESEIDKLADNIRKEI
jgi:hypothetical protein